MNNKTEFKFGDYAIIEQKRHGAPNEMFVHKVIDQLRSNTWVDVPVQSPATETIHDEMEDVCWCICCGVSETEVRKYRVRDMRRHSPVSAVTDEKRGSTITLQAVNELITSLESAGELSIREQKFLKLAKAYQQLAAENVALKQFPEQIVQFIGGLGASEIGIDTKEKIGLAAIRIKTPATDACLAGIKADGVEMFVEKCREESMRAISSDIRNNWWLAGEHAEDFAAQLREGADK